MYPDGSRRRRNADDKRAKWYAYYRSIRFCRRFGLLTNCHEIHDEEHAQFFTLCELVIFERNPDEQN